MTGAPYDKENLYVSNFDMAGAFNETNAKKAMEIHDEEFEKQITAESMKNNDYFKKFA